MARSGRSGSKERHWRQVIDRWRSSGLSVRAYCQAHRITEQSFYWWRRELSRRGQSQPPTPDCSQPQFLPVCVVTDAVAPSNTEDTVIEVVLARGRCLRVRAGFDRTTLVRLLEVLEDGAKPC